MATVTEPVDIAMRLLKQEDTLDYKCPQCGGQGGFYEGPFDGEGGTDYDYITCITCQGDGTIEPKYHPGQDNQGAVGADVFDIRDEQHRQEYDVENAMPYGNKVVAHGDGEILDPKRMGFSRDGRMKQTAHPIAPQEIIESEHPALRHRLPTVYTREWDGRPTNRGLNITGAGGSDFKRGEPMDLAMRLLKEDPLHLQPSNTLARRAKEELKTDKMGENSPAYQEMMERMMEMYEPQDETIPLEENLDQYAQETGKNPWRMLPGREIPNKYGGTAKVQLDPITPIHPQQFYDWQAKNASEPMDIAMRLLKGSNDPPYDPDNPYWQDPNWKNYVDPDPLGAFGIPQSTWDEIAAGQEEEGNKVQTPQEIAMEVFNERTENVYDSPDTHCQLHGERLQPIVDPQSIRQFPKGADENMYCTACEQNITNEPRQPQQFDIDEDTRRKLTGEPMNIAMRLLKAKSKGQESLTEWTKEKWEFVGDDKKEMKKPRHKRGRYAPKSVADSMSPSQKATENKKKRAAHKKGKQHAPRGKSVKPMYRAVEGKK